jgi:hypothetical protein
MTESAAISTHYTACRQTKQELSAAAQETLATSVTQTLVNNYHVSHVRVMQIMNSGAKV